MKSVKTFTNNALIGGYSDRLNQLSTKISDIKRLLSYYDVFNIKEVVENQEEFVVKLNALMPNSSLVINTDPFEYAGVVYSRGDFVLKDINENFTHIESKTSGIYYPSLKQLENGNLVVSYSYSGNQPTPGEKEYNLGEQTEPYSTIIFKGFSQESGQIYAYWGPIKDWDGVAIQKITESSEDLIEYIQPVLKFYWVDNKEDPIEEIALEYKLELTGSEGNKTWGLSLTDDEDNFLFNNVYIKVK